MQPRQSADGAKEQRLLAKREQQRAALLQDFATTQKTTRRRLKEVEGPRMRDQIQHKVTSPTEQFGLPSTASNIHVTGFG